MFQGDANVACWVLNSKNHYSSINILVLQIPSSRPMHPSPIPKWYYWLLTMHSCYVRWKLLSASSNFLTPPRTWYASNLAWRKLLAEGGKQRLSQLASIWDHLKGHPSYRAHHGISWGLSFNCTGGQFSPLLIPTLFISLQVCLPRPLLHKLLHKTLHLRICFSGIHYKTASSNILHQNYLNCCSKHSPITPTVTLTPMLSSIINNEVFHRLVWETCYSTLFTLLCLIRFCSIPQNSSYASRTRLVPYKNETCWRIYTI